MSFKFDNNYAKQDKWQLMETGHCNITEYLPISVLKSEVLLSIDNILC